MGVMCTHVWAYIVVYLDKSLERKTNRPLRGVAVPWGFLQTCSTELLEAEVEAEGRRFLLDPP